MNRASHSYILALGSNRGWGHTYRPEAMIALGIAALADAGIAIAAIAPTITSAPIGPAQRRFANSAVRVSTPLHPPALLALLKRIENGLGRRRGQRWGNRTIDIDIILWSGGQWHDRTLSIPHPAWRERMFVLRPLLAIAADWRDPVTGLTVRHIAQRCRASRQ
jgi:2-amino-4-hydroxy-6-hydroxymethyldihydropteridine diphosphokinase